MAEQRKKPVSKTTKKRSTRKVIDKNPHELTQLDYHAIQLHELFQAFKRAGFDHGTAITLILDQDAHPFWFNKTTASYFAEWDELEEEEGDD